MKLLTPPDYSHKTELGLKSGIGQAILYLAPSNEAGPGVNLCPGHSPECFKHCLIHSGQMIMPHAHAARVRKTKLLLEQPEEFGKLLHWDVDAHLRWCHRRGLFPAFRFNGTSDYHWETWTVPHLGSTIHEYLYRVAPEAVINEYTKRYSVMRHWLEGAYKPNLYMTFSLHELNEQQALKILELGGNVTVVFSTRKGQRLPSQWFARPVLDGDVDDLRWMDNARARRQGLDPSRGLVVGLRAKGILTRVDSPFAIDPRPKTTRIPLPLAA